MRIAIVMAAALMLAGCSKGGVTYANAKADIAGWEFVDPMPGMIAIYAYRADVPQPPVLSIWAGDKHLGSLGPRTWLRADIAPGRFDLRCQGGPQGPGSMSVDLRGSYTYFFEVGPPAGGASCTIVEMPETTGRGGVLSGVRTQPPYQRYP
jgi:hypothetical protein